MSLFEMSFSGAVFIIAVVIVRAVLINRIPKKTFLVLWEISFLRLLIPFSIPFMFSIYTLIGQLLQGSAFFGTDTDVVRADWAQGQDAMTQEIRKLSPDMFSSHSLWFIIWCTGMIILALLFAFSYICCRIEFQTSLPVSNGYVEQWLKEHSIKRSILVRQSDNVMTPLTYGIFHPVILMPKSTDWENTKELPYILSHEYVHICRFDVVKKLIATVVLCVHWFNPFVWVMYILFNRDIELVCDESVVRQFGEKSRAVYSLMLINMEERQSGLLPFCSNFSKNAIEERITAIMKMKKVTILSFAIACFIVCGIVTAFATSAQAGKGEAEKGSTINNNTLEVNAGIVNTDALKVRSEADADAEVLSLLEQGAVIKLIGEENDFYQIVIEDQDGNESLTGYVKKEYVNPR